MRRVFALLVAILLSTAMFPAAEAADWPVFQGDSLHTGIAADKDLADTLDLIWSMKLDGPLKGSPIVADGLVYLGTEAGSAYAIGAKTGKIVWGPKALGLPVMGTPAYENNRVYFATSSLDGSKGNLTVMQAKTGELITSKSMGAGSYGGPVVFDGKLFVGTDAGTVLAYETEGMLKLWEYKTAVSIDSKLVPSNPDAECCLRANVKEKPVKTIPIVYNGKVYFSAFNHLLFAVDQSGNPGAETTSLVWTENVHDIVYSSAAIDKLRSTIVVGSYDGRMYAYDTEPYGFKNSCQNHTKRSYHPVGNDCSKTIRWNYDTSSRIFSSPAVSMGHAFVGDNDGTLHAVNMVSGKASWTYKAKGGIYSSPAIVNDTIVVGSYDGKLYMFKTSPDGKTVNTPFTFTLGGKLHSSPAIADGLVYIGSDDGMFHALAEPGSVEKPAATTPDITVTAIDFSPNPPIAGQPTQVIVSMKNLGQVDSSPAGVALYNGGSKVEQLQVQLAAGQTKNQSFTMVPMEGNMTVRAVFDESGALDELDEDNNAFERTISVLPGTDGGPGTSGEDDGGSSDEEDAPAVGLVSVLAMLGVLAVALRRRR